MWPSTCDALQRSSMIAKSGMHWSIVSDTIVECGRSKREETSLARAGYAHFLTIPWSIFSDIVESTDATDYHSLIIVFVTVVHIEFPIPHQRTIEHIVIDLLLHRHRHSVNADLQGDGTLRGSIDIATIRTHACTWHSQQSRISPFLHRHTKNAICTIVLLHVLERNFIYVHILGTTLR